MLAILKENIELARDVLRVPLVLENIACTFEQPLAEMDEATFVSRVLEQSDCGLLLDLSNLFANAHNMGFSASNYLRSLPLERLKYVHLAGGTFKRGLYHDTHCHPLKQQSLELLAELAQLAIIPRVMLERDDSFPPEDEFNGELDAIKQTIAESRRAQPVIIASMERLVQPSVKPAVKPLGQTTALLMASIVSRQEGLTRALLGVGDIPDGFDRERLEEAVQALSRKRLRAIKRAHPCLIGLFSKTATDKASDQQGAVAASELALDQALLAYFAKFPSVHQDGPFADSQVFLKQMSAR
jgi:hypothetical protein